MAEHQKRSYGTGDDLKESSPLRQDFRPQTLQGPDHRTAIEGMPMTERPSLCRKYAQPKNVFLLLTGASLVIAAVALIVWITAPNSSANTAQVLRAAGADGNSSEYGVVLEIPQGKLKWNVLTTREGRDYYAFYKVPYAKPPIGELRFESPQAPEKWEGVRFEKEVAPQCLQRSKYSPAIEAVGEEDCLYANIYTPKLPGIDLKSDEPLLPTLFYIHGGGFTDGNGSRYGGKYFLDEDAVLVTFQYRLGIFGFLSSEDGTIKGNMAMKDQVQAMKWVKDNIRYFGGDPDRVMIYGNSAGAMSVNQQMVSPMAAGLFHRAITQSGPKLKSMVQPKELQLKSYELLATEVGCWPSTTNERRRNRRVLKCLRDLNASDIAIIRGPEIIFASTIESYESEDESDKFLPDTIYNLYQSGRANKVPWIIGVNSAEWVHVAAMKLSDPEAFESMSSNWTGFAPTTNMYMEPYTESPIMDTISTKSREFYFGNKPIGNETLLNLTNILSDRDVVYSAKVEGMWMTELGGSNVYLYYLSKRPLKSYSDKALIGYPPGDYGASHADELQYLFDYYGYPEYLPGSGSYFDFSRELVRIWVKFAATGDPGWAPIKPGQNPISWYELNDHMGPTTILQKRIEFWDQFSPQELCYV